MSDENMDSLEEKIIREAEDDMPMTQPLPQMTSQDVVETAGSMRPQSRAKVSKTVQQQPFSERHPFIMFIIIFLVISFGLKAALWAKDFFAGNAVYKQMYGLAVEEVREKWTDVYNLEIDAYKEEYVAWQCEEKVDFGRGELWYQKYAVKVPVECDMTYGHVDTNITVEVYCYRKEMLHGADVVPSIEDHCYVIDLYADWYDAFDW